MAIKQTRGERIFAVGNYFLLGGLAFLTLYPILYVIMASLSDPRMLMKHEGAIFWPLGKATLIGYIQTLRSPSILVGYRNTLFYVSAGTAINLTLTFLAAYVLSRKNFYLKKFMMFAIVVTMFFHGGLIPMFMILKSLRMYNTIWALLLPTAINTWNIIIVRTFFQSIPESLEESAVIDGATDFVLLTRIILPLSMPVVAVMILDYGVAHWNSWFNAMVFLRDRGLFPLQLFLREILIQNNTDRMVQGGAEMMEESYTKELVKYCTIVISTLPILCIYPFLQKYFVKGVMIGAIKG